MRTLNNTVIKNLTPEMGRKIIKKYQDDGWNTGSWGPYLYESYSEYHYYGVIGGEFDVYTIGQVNESKARIIELEEEWQPVRGERVLVWSIDESIAEEKIYITTIEGSKNPIVTVSTCDESQFENGKKFSINVYQNMKRIETNTELQELEAKYRELGEQIEKLKNKQ